MPKIFDCVQGTLEWQQCRLGIATASDFHSLLAQGEGKTRKTYLLKLIGERLTGEPTDPYTSLHMERGKIMEAEAREIYSFDVHDLKPVGFIRRSFEWGDVGCSPDALVGEKGLLEIKTKLPHLQLDVLLKNRLPPEHVAQCQGALWVSGRKWLDFVSYWPGLPLFVHREFPNEEYFEKLEAALVLFYREMKETMALLPQSPSLRIPKRPPQISPTTEFRSLD